MKKHNLAPGESYIYDFGGLNDNSIQQLKSNLSQKNADFQNSEQVLVEGQQAYKTKIIITSEESRYRFTNSQQKSDYILAKEFFQTFDFEANKDMLSLIMINIDYNNNKIEYFERQNGKIVNKQNNTLVYKQGTDAFNAYLKLMLQSLSSGKIVPYNGDEAGAFGIIGDCNIWQRMTIFGTYAMDVHAELNINEKYFFTVQEMGPGSTIKRLRIPKVMAGIINGVADEIFGVAQMINMVLSLVEMEIKEPGSIKNVINGFSSKMLITDYAPCYANPSNCNPESKKFYWRPKQIVSITIFIVKNILTGGTATFGKAPVSTNTLKGMASSSSGFVHKMNMLVDVSIVEDVSKLVKKISNEFTNDNYRNLLQSFGYNITNHADIFKISTKVDFLANTAKLIAHKNIPGLEKLEEFLDDVEFSIVDNKNMVTFKAATNGPITVAASDVEKVFKQLTSTVRYGTGNSKKATRLAYFEETVLQGNDMMRNSMDIKGFFESCLAKPELAELITSKNKFKMFHAYQEVLKKDIQDPNFSFKDFIDVFSTPVEKKISDGYVNALMKVYNTNADVQNAAKAVIRGLYQAVKEADGNLDNLCFSDYIRSSDFYKILNLPTQIKSIEHSFLGISSESAFRNLIYDNSIFNVNVQKAKFLKIFLKDFNAADYTGFKNLPIEVFYDGKWHKPRPDLVFIKMNKHGEIENILIFDNKFMPTTSMQKPQAQLRNVLRDGEMNNVRIAKKVLETERYFLEGQIDPKFMNAASDYIKLPAKTLTDEVGNPRTLMHKLIFTDKAPDIPENGFSREAPTLGQESHKDMKHIGKNEYKFLNEAKMVVNHKNVL